MSANNAIIVLETLDEYRVGHFQCVDNLYWSWENPNNNAVVPIRVFEFFYDIKPIKRIAGCHKKVLESAKALFEDVSYVDYGIITIAIEKEFKEIAYQAMIEAEGEMLSIKRDGILPKETKKMLKAELKTTIENIIKWVSEHD